MRCESLSRHRQDAGRRGASRRSRDAEGDADRRAPPCRTACCDHQGIAAPPRWSPRQEPGGRVNCRWRPYASSCARWQRPRRTKPSRRPRARRERANRTPTAVSCRPSCRASRPSSTSRTRPARVARARCTGSARASASVSRHPSRPRIFLASRASFRSMATLASRAFRQRWRQPRLLLGASPRSIGWKPAMRRPSGPFASAFRLTRPVAAREARPRQPEELAGRSDPLCALPLGSRCGELGRHRLAD